jgi:hypothetical protein
MSIDNRLVRTFFENTEYQYRMKLIYRDGNPRVGISTFYPNKGNWCPGKKHFFMKYEEWNNFMSKVFAFNEDVQRGIFSLPINYKPINRCFI